MFLQPEVAQSLLYSLGIVSNSEGLTKMMGSATCEKVLQDDHEEDNNLESLSNLDLYDCGNAGSIVANSLREAVSVILALPSQVGDRQATVGCFHLLMQQNANPNLGMGEDPPLSDLSLLPPLFLCLLSLS